MRWPIETTLEEGKGEVGLDHFETRSWAGWHQHMLLVSLAHHFLVRLRVQLNEQAAARTLYQVRVLLLSVLPKPNFDAAAALDPRRATAQSCGLRFAAKEAVGAVQSIQRLCAVILEGSMFKGMPMFLRLFQHFSTSSKELTIVGFTCLPLLLQRSAGVPAILGAGFCASPHILLG
jgi:hypothetical protein